MTKNRFSIVSHPLLMAIILVSLLVSIFPVSIAMADTIVDFPDPGLQQAIRDAIGKPTGDIYQADLDSLTSLTAENKGISDLSGLEHCTSLTYLSLYSNQIGNISQLAGLTSLTNLNLNSNQISDISPLSGLTSLYSLGLCVNQISNISPLSGLSSLEALCLVSNQISDISPLSGLTSLTLLILGVNQISNISPLSGLTSLTLLILGVNQISDISPLSGLTNLTDLYLYVNQISDISPLSGLTSLNYLRLESNQISDIQALVNNQGLATGDSVYLYSNPLSTDSMYVYIPQLQGRGVEVYYDVPVESTPVTGITREVRGDILPGVSVTLDGIGPVLSDQDGQYEIMATATGNYTVTAHKDGFRDRTQTINIAGLGAGYAVTCNFQGQHGLIPNAPDIWYALDCVNLWLYPPNQDIGLDIWTALDVINAWLYPVAATPTSTPTPIPTPTPTPAPTPTPMPTPTPTPEFIPLGEALDNTELIWTTGGDSDWFGQASISYYDNDSAQTGIIGDNQSTWLRTTVVGTGTLSFYWKVSSDASHDWLEFSWQDEAGPHSVKRSGIADWRQESPYIQGSGSHVVEWKYYKDGSGSNGVDAGWVDKVQWLPTGPLPSPTPTPLPPGPLPSPTPTPTPTPTPNPSATLIGTWYLISINGETPNGWMTLTFTEDTVTSAGGLLGQPSDCTEVSTYSTSGGILTCTGVLSVSGEACGDHVGDTFVLGPFTVTDTTLTITLYDPSIDPPTGVFVFSKVSEGG